MKVIAINGSPRPNFTTAKLLKAALEGAEEVGAETDYIDLYKKNYKGCISCFACKRIEHESCVCRVKDELSPLLEEIHGCDALILGSPIYFGDVTAGMQGFLERLIFPALSYDTFSSIYDGKVNGAFFYTMNASDASGYQQLMEQKTGMLRFLNGEAESYPCTFTVQFNDYSKYHAAQLEGDARIAHQAVQFPIDLENAKAVGRKLASK